MHLLDEWIHLMFCTQRPTNDIIPTYISCNCGIRIGLRTSNEQESRNIIEENGLELIDNECIGAGVIKAGDLTRIQGFFLDDKKVKEICDKHYVEFKDTIETLVLNEEKKSQLNWREIARGM